MWKATIRGLLARKIRLASTALAILLGVSFIAATYVLTDSVKQSFDAVFEQTVSRVDLVVRGANSLGGTSDPPRIAEAALDQVRGVPGVANATGYVQGSAQFVGHDGSTIGGGGPPTLGVSWVPHGPGRLVHDGRSRPPRNAHEVLMDAATARDHGFAVGDRVRILLRGPAQQFRIVGLFGFGNRFDFGAVTFAAFDLRTAQQVLGAQGALDAIYVKRDSSSSTSALTTRLERALGPAYTVLTGPEASKQVGKPVRQFLGFFTYALLGFAAIGVVVGAFIIFNTFTILLTQRTRELGLLRALGASGNQVVWSVVLEALFVGVVASLVGVAAGVGVGAGLLELLRQLGVALPETQAVVLGRTVAVALAVGVGVTVVAALFPALRAARVPPVAAINDVPERALTGFGRRLRAGAVVALIGVGVLAYGLARADDVHDLTEQVLLVAMGAFGVLVGIVLLLPAVVRPVVGKVGATLRAFGPSGVLARANAMRNPRRTAVTASALVIGLALVGLTATFGESAKASVREETARGLRADFVIKTGGFASFSSDVAARLVDVPSVTDVVSMRFADAQVGGDLKTIGAALPSQLDRVVALGFVSGGVEGLDEAGVIISDEVARNAHVSMGDRLQVQFARSLVPLVVRGIYRNQNFIGIFGQTIPLIVSPDTMASGTGGTAQDSLVLVRSRPGAESAVKRAMKRELHRDFPNIDVLTRDEFRSEQLDFVDQFLAVFVAILALSEIIAILGIVNTLALSVFERTRELGLLRVVGMSRRQMRRMVRWESVVIALIGGVIGLAVGLLWGWAFARALRDQGITVFRVPVVQTMLFVVGSMFAGVLAAVIPAWRASRLDVLEAIAAE